MKHKTFIVTAASEGIGAAIAQLLAEKGANVALMARSEAVLTLAKNLGGIALQGSVSDEAALTKLVEMTIQRFGRIDGVVNNTGHPTKGDLLSISDDEWHKDLDLLFLNVVRMARLVTPLMERQKSGAFVNISSASAFEPSLEYPVSSALRAGLASFSKLYADRYAPFGIRMNTVLPGFIDTFQVPAHVVDRIPLHRPGTTKELAAVVAFLLSDAAAYVTGQNIRVDGGLSKHI